MMQILAPGNWLGDDNGHQHWASLGHYPPNEYERPQLSKANIQVERAKISMGHSVLSGVINGRISVVLLDRLMMEQLVLEQFVPQPSHSSFVSNLTDKRLTKMMPP